MRRLKVNPEIFWTMASLVSVGLLAIVLLLGINAIGTQMEPAIRHHETEQAHCYTASKMVFVSVACIPKGE